MENSAPSLKIFRFVKIVEIKIGGKNLIKNILKQLFHSTLFYPARKKLFYLQFSLLRRTKLRISQDICYLELQILRES